MVEDIRPPRQLLGEYYLLFEMPYTKYGSKFPIFSEFYNLFNKHEKKNVLTFRAICTSFLKQLHMGGWDHQQKRLLASPIS
jgi:hypothetical protein